MKRTAAGPTDIARVRRIFLRLRGARGINDDELLQHAIFLAKSSEERCRISVQTARSALSFDAEFRRSPVAMLEGQPIRVLPLRRVIASKRASGRDKDVAVLPVLERALRLGRRLGSPRRPRRQSKALSSRSTPSRPPRQSLDD